MSFLHSLYFPLSPDPTPDPVLRRAGLDNAGVNAQICAVGVIAILTIYRNLFATHLAGAGAKRSWLDKPVFSGAESWRVSIVVGAWAALVVGLGMRDVGQDYLHLTRLPAHLAASLLPIHLALSHSSPLSPLPTLLRTTRATLIPYHKLHGWFLLSLLSAHATLYLNFYVQKSLLSKRIRDTDVQLGLLMAGTLAALGWFSRGVVRKRSRGLFLGVHFAGTATVLAALWWHVEKLPGVRWYVAEAGAVFVLGMGARAARTVRS